MKIIKILMAIILSMILANLLFANKFNHKRKYFQYLDKDKDDHISKKEWMSKFKKIDFNQDGKISKKEMKKYHKKSCKSHKKK